MQFVLIGGPSTGKTTVIQRLSDMGFLTVEDTARRLLRDESIVKPTVDRHQFQQEVFRQQLLAEKSTVGAAEPSFLDGGVFDGCAYYLCDGLEVPPIFDTISGERYQQAFLFEDLNEFTPDGIRYQDEATARRLTPLFQECYQQRGVPLTRVPVGTVDERIALILKKSELNVAGRSDCN